MISPRRGVVIGFRYIGLVLVLVLVLEQNHASSTRTSTRTSTNWHARSRPELRRFLTTIVLRIPIRARLGLRRHEPALGSGAATPTVYRKPNVKTRLKMWQSHLSLTWSRGPGFRCRNNLAEFALRFGSDLAIPIEQNQRRKPCLRPD